MIIPGANQVDQSTSDALVNALRKEAFDFRILTGKIQIFEINKIENSKYFRAGGPRFGPFSYTED